MKSKFHWLIFVGMIAGVLFGYYLMGVEDASGATYSKSNIIKVLDLFGKTIFIGALKMIVAPLIFFSIICAITSLGSSGQLLKMGYKTIMFYIITTSLAVGIGLFFVLTIKPGMSKNRDDIRANWQQSQKELSQTYSSEEARISEAKELSSFDVITNSIDKMIENPFSSLAQNQSLGIIFFAILLGIALITLGKQSESAISVFQGLNAAIMQITGWVMAGCPIFVFCLMASLVGSLGLEVFRTLSIYLLTVLVGIAAHIIILLVICRVFGKMSPWRFLKGIREAWMVAFATRSSAATLPVTLNCVQENLGVRAKTADFVLPLGATVNMDGTALYEGVAVIFIIQLFGGMPGVPLELTPVATVVIFLTAVLASIGAAAVPQAGLVTMVLVANAVGLSVAYIPIIFAVDAFLDMFRTSTNVLGDSVGAVVIDRLIGDEPE
ncbi:MAG: dicarboxylate/amino acid:cation symporter [Phycisphaerae bacterium]|nr:dicarboxylate/amino acid:cation symporter [Phycisphaerae bacterium]